MADISLAGWTIEEVAKRAGCAKGLVIYHHQTKRQLLELTAHSIGAQIHASRLAGLRLRPPLDGLWAATAETARSGYFGALISLRAIGLPPQQPSLANELMPAVARALDIPLEALVDQVAMEAVLEGLALRLLAGVPETVVRQGYDQLWVNMIRG